MNLPLALACLVAAELCLNARVLGESSTRQYVVHVSGLTASGQEADATGVIIGTNAGLRIATAANVAALRNLTVVTQSGEALAVNVSYVVRGFDFAVLQTARPVGHYDSARPARSIANNEAAEVWSYGAQSAPRRLPAVILGAKTHVPHGGRPMLALTCNQCASGDSGAGIFAKDGTLIGILSARWTEGEPAAALAEAMASN